MRIASVRKQMTCGRHEDAQFFHIASRIDSNRRDRISRHGLAPRLRDIIDLVLMANAQAYHRGLRSSP